ncbi:unnamed protein product [Paramecium sonneborni]|uniref:Uncharacterized protein n=1 Tax=Paramecium sonneborni TaxID=65129 RepID=A0A8S1N955_9CILI|nr:unnamed protein product [Paramecium sonneborni]
MQKIHEFQINSTIYQIQTVLWNKALLIQNQNQNAKQTIRENFF